MARPRARVVPAVVREPAWCYKDGDIDNAEGATEYAGTEDDLLCLSFEGDNMLLVGGTREGRGFSTVSDSLTEKGNERERGGRTCCAW